MCATARSIFGTVIGSILCFCLFAAEESDKFLFLTLRYKDGDVALLNSTIVSGKLKPIRNSSKTNAFHIVLEKADGKSAVVLAIDDPSVRRYEYEDPQQRTVIRSKEVKVNDVEFIVRMPLVAGIRHVAIYRQESPSSGSKQPAVAVKKLIARHKLPPEATQ